VLERSIKRKSLGKILADFVSRQKIHEAGEGRMRIVILFDIISYMIYNYGRIFGKIL